MSWRRFSPILSGNIRFCSGAGAGDPAGGMGWGRRPADHCAEGCPRGPDPHVWEPRAGSAPVLHITGSKWEKSGDETVFLGVITASAGKEEAVETE